MPAEDAYVEGLAQEIAEAIANVIGPLLGPKPLLTTRQVASKLNIGERKVAYMLERGEIASVLIGDGSRRIEQEELQRYIAAQRDGGER